ncbi:hypothetical protein [Microbacterium sp. BK668]|uniref:hypothetical protein n=1 Tax=Microbacterium sp. BK668 TaxID=2512118 RepID=UPI001061F732|nr:hypothetical protein [Microbacterium sp. BK668]TDN92608.1 hypothetical protein EV279_2133 [Microbacterium sp. BK668]
MNTTRNTRKVFTAAVIVALVGSLAACSTAERTEFVHPVAHGAGQLSASLQIEQQIDLARTSRTASSSVQLIQQDIAAERERLHPSSAAGLIQEDISKERDRLAGERAGR